MDQLAAHQRAQDAFAAVLAKVAADQLDAPTPCSEWSVRDLVGHVIAGNQRLAGGTPPADSDLAGLIEAHATSAVAAQAVFAAPDGLTRSFEMPFGPVPGSVVIGLRTTDVLTHTWDLAQGTGQPSDVDPVLAAEMLEVCRQRIKPDFRGPGRPFGEEEPCDANRPAADQLAAFLGRAMP